MPGNPDDYSDEIVTDPKAVERAVNSLPGVVSSRLVTNRAGNVLELHVVASTDRGSRDILRDIESTLDSGFGIQITRDQINLASMDGDPADEWGAGSSEPSPSKGTVSMPRIRFVNLRTNLTADGGDVQVTLGRGRHQGIGQSSFVLGSTPALAASEATLRAMERFYEDASFRVASVDVRPVGSHEGVFVHIEANRRGRVVPLLGSAIVQRDLALSTLFATLDAINRFVGRLRPAEAVEWVVGPDTELDSL